jgi:ribosomal-protein-alanine N-acetyltransferase
MMGTVVNIVLEPATASDVAAIADMSARLVEAGLPHSWGARRVLNHVRGKNSQVVVARNAGELIGFSIMNFGQEAAHLSLLAVEPGYRRQNIGRQLMNWQEASAVNAGIFFVDLEVRASNHRAMHFYSRLGYLETGQVPDYYSGADDAILFAKDLTVRESRETAFGDDPA